MSEPRYGGGPNDTTDLTIDDLREVAIFDAFEVQKVAEYRVGYDDAYCEPIIGEAGQAIADEEASSQFWTVYGHYPNGGVMAIKDLNTKDEAVAVAYALANGRPVEVF